MIRLLRFIQGYVIFEATGGFTERFLNLCKFNQLNLWNVKNDGKTIVAHTTAKEFESIVIPAQKSGMEITLVKETGLPFYLRRYKWRCGLIAGCVFVALFLWFMSGFIWNVEIVADNDVKINGFTEYVEEIGVKIGARKSGIDILQVQEKLLNEFSELSWVSLNIFGTKAQIEYTYANPQKPIADKYTLTNVVAGKNGKITLVEGYVGVSMVSSGVNVAKGSLLISGIIKNADSTESFVHASGKVYARTVNEINESCIHNCSVNLVSESDALLKFDFFGVKIPFGKLTPSDLKTTAEIYVKGNNNTLPVGFLRDDFLTAQESEVQFTAPQAKLLCLLDCVNTKRAEYSDTQLEKVTLTQTEKQGETTVKMEIICVENIAVEVPVSVEEN